MRKLRKKKNKKHVTIIVYSALVLLLTMTAGYAAFATNIAINAKGNLAKEATCTLNHEWTYEANPYFQNLKIPCTGTYKIELWGAQGGGDYGAKGGYVSGEITLPRNENLYFVVGETGRGTYYNVSGYNGGGRPISGYNALRTIGTAGGGATDVRLTNGVWNSFDSLKSRIMVAAGGGGSVSELFEVFSEGVAGGLSGGNGASGGSVCATTSGTQTRAGYASCTNYEGSGGFGFGGTLALSAEIKDSGGGGGGGYYGGGAGNYTNESYMQQPGNGAGGSSFISGHEGCNAIDKNSTSNNIIHTNQSIHYSNYSFTNTKMIDGSGCKWTTQKTTDCSGMPNTIGTGIEIGHSGDGYAKITLISIG